MHHSECVSKHKVYDRNHEVVPCHGPFEKFIIDNDKEANIKKTSTSTGSNRDRLGSTGSVESVTIPSSRNRTAGTSRSSDIDIKIDWLVRIVKEMKDERACKKEVKMMVKKIVREESGNVKQELEDLRKMIQRRDCDPSRRTQRNYSKVVKKKKKNIIIIKPKVRHESDSNLLKTTKRLIREKVDRSRTRKS